MNRLIGIMADSHGDLYALKAGVALLTKMGCSVLYHLGDICDSTRPDTVEPCLDVMRNHGVLAVKGNNEHAVFVNFSEGGSMILSDACAQFLKGLPLVRQWRDAVFTHSLPFERELGLSAMVRTMGDMEAMAFFETHPHSILFRGHSHIPGVVRLENKKSVSVPVNCGEYVELEWKRPCIVTCGALIDGVCMVWDTDSDRVFFLDGVS